MHLKQFDLTGRVALVTGGSKGLGKAMARGLAEAGARVVISSRNEAELQRAAGEIANGLSTSVDYFVTDMTDRSQVQSLAERATAVHGQVDIVINNAGSNKPQPLDAIDDASWDNLLELNLTSCMSLARHLTPGMKARRWGRIIYISSIMALASNPDRSAYSATKAALIGMARAQALELGEFGITVNCIAPGPFLTDLPTSLLNAEQQQSFARRTALGRWGRPDEMAGPALLLASDAGSYITGATLLVDGGVLCRTF